MRVTEEATAILIVLLSLWCLTMWVATDMQFQGNESSRILRVELGSDAADLDQAVKAPDAAGVERNVQLIRRNTYMDYVFILLYWLTFVSLAVLEGQIGLRRFAVATILLITLAALCDLLENGTILTFTWLSSYTDSVAVDISQISILKWSLFFSAMLVLGLGFAVNHRISNLRRIAGGLLIASGVFGLLGIVRYRVAIDFSILMVNFSLLLIAAALLLTLWKLWHSIRTPGARRAHSPA